MLYVVHIALGVLCVLYWECFAYCIRSVVRIVLSVLSYCVSLVDACFGFVQEDILV